jgi:class I fructose-bisphosphate aldolase
MIDKISEYLREEANELLDYKCKGIKKESLNLPGPDFVDRVLIASDRSPAVLRNLQLIFDTGRLAGTGYLSVLPVDQGIEHSAGASFAPNPLYFDPENIVKLAIEGGCNAVASTLGVLGSVSRKYAHKIPFILKINHNELLTYPNIYNQTLFADVEQAFNMGAVVVGATIYFGSNESRRQIMEISEAFKLAHELGLGVTIEADIIKQKQPENNGGYTALKFGKTHEDVYNKLTTDHPIDLTRYQVANCYMGRVWA